MDQVVIDHLGIVVADLGIARRSYSFYGAGLAHGGSDNGAPGERKSFGPYYAAYLLDPDGNNVEAGFRSA